MLIKKLLALLLASGCAAAFAAAPPPLTEEPLCAPGPQKALVVLEYASHSGPGYVDVFVSCAPDALNTEAGLKRIIDVASKRAQTTMALLSVTPLKN